MENIEHVESGAQDMQDTAVVTFRKVLKASEKGPKYRYTVALDGALSGLVLSGPVMQDSKTGSYIPRVPSIYGDDAVQIAKIEEVFNNHTFSRDDEDGAHKMENWTGSLLTAFLAFLQTGKATQRVSFRR